MDDTKISLPCGLDITYGNLKKRQKTSKCVLCGEEDFSIGDVLNRPGNRLRLKEKQFELEIENLRKLNVKLLAIKQDPRLHVEQSFERILNDLEIRREELKNNIESQINEYCDGLRVNLESEKKQIIDEINQNLVDENEFPVLKPEISTIENPSDVKEKLQFFETSLIEIGNKSEKIQKSLSDIGNGENFQLFYSNKKLPMENILGKIHKSNLFEYKETKTVDAHWDSILCLERVDENRFLSASRDKTIKLWNTNDKKFLMKFKDDNSLISSICMLKHDLFASVSDRKNIKVWDISSGEFKWTIMAHKHPIHHLKLLPNESLASCSGDKTIKIWNFESGECLQTLTGHTDSVYAIERGLCDTTIISGSGDCSIRIWNCKTGEHLETLMGHNKSVVCLKLIKSGKLASGSADKTIKIWNLETNELLNTLVGHSEIVIDLAVLKSDHLLSFGDDRTVKFWDIDQSDCLKSINTTTYDIYCFLLMDNEDIILGYSEDIKFFSKNSQNLK